MQPLQQAARQLFGLNSQRHYPIMPVLKLFVRRKAIPPVVMKLKMEDGYIRCYCLQLPKIV